MFIVAISPLMFSSGIDGRGEFKSMRGASMGCLGTLFRMVEEERWAEGLLSSMEACVQDPGSVWANDPELLLGFFLLLPPLLK